MFEINEIKESTSISCDVTIEKECSSVDTKLDVENIKSEDVNIFVSQIIKQEEHDEVERKVEPNAQDHENNKTEENVPKNIICEETEKEEVQQNWSYAKYNWTITPQLLCTATEEYKPSHLYENFTKGCSWAPDGTCLLVPAEDYRIRLYELPKEMYSGKKPDMDLPPLKPALTVKDGGTIYDSCWYPYMNSWDATTCCFLSTSKESPVHLWDAFNGELRATYRAYNQVDEVEASISVQFINYGQEIWCGFKNLLRKFDTNRPGRQVDEISFKNSFPNMNGLVSCIRENPAMPGLVAFGTYSKYIGLFKDVPLCSFLTGSGVTQIEFSPCGTKLYSAVRRNREFICWDLRNPGTILWSSDKRQSDTNQRIQFSVSIDGSEIISGGTDGCINIWHPEDSSNSEQDLNPVYKIPLSVDCINGVSLHKTLPILATTSGQRITKDEDIKRDNSVRFWYCSAK